MAKRNLYLTNTPIEEAKKIYEDALRGLTGESKKEMIPVIEIRASTNLLLLIVKQYAA